MLDIKTLTPEQKQAYWNKLNPAVPHMDAVTTALAIEDLTVRISETVFSPQNTANAMSMGKIIPFKPFPGYEGVEEVDIAFVTPVGMARVISGSENGGPPVTTVSTRARFYVKTQSSSAHTTFDSIIKARQRGQEIDVSQVVNLKRAEENYFGIRGWIGDPDFNLLGLHNCPCPEYIPVSDVYSITDGQLLENVFTEAVSRMVSGLGISRAISGEGDASRYPRKWVMSMKLFQFLSRVRIPNTQVRVLDSVLEYIERLTGIEPTLFVDDNCQNVSLIGYTGLKEVFYFLPDDRDKLAFGDFMAFDVTTPQPNGLNFVTYSYFRTSLVIPADPLSMMRGVL